MIITKNTTNLEIEQKWRKEYDHFVHVNDKDLTLSGNYTIEQLRILFNMISLRDYLLLDKDDNNDPDILGY